MAGKRNVMQEFPSAGWPTSFMKMRYAQFADLKSPLEQGYAASHGSKLSKLVFARHAIR